jgi:hypothetical protein
MTNEAAITVVRIMMSLYGCLPSSKKNLCCSVKKSAASLYPALLV